MTTQSEADTRNLRTNLIPTPNTWQKEVWDFYDSLGMFRNAVTWKSDMLSRVRLRAGVKSPDRDEPTILEKGPAVDLVNGLSGGFSNQAQLISNLAVYISVPGEGYMVGEGPPEAEIWTARSQDEVRAKRSTAGLATYEVVSEAGSGTAVVWRELAPNSMVVRVWRPHKRWYHVADSNSRAARGTMRELELANRHIASQYMSRLASAGVLVLPSEVTFPVRAEFADAVDPFIAEWIETASEALKTPGTAAAIVPIPIRVPGEYVDKIRHIDFTLLLDRQIIQKRNSAVQQLATDLDIPQEALLGMGNANHWSGWLIDEQGFKVYLAPDMELICQALTYGWLYPKLMASGQDVNTSDGQIVVWYDPSELVLRPDRSADAVLAYDRFELNGKALRRETGFTEDDVPTKKELGDIILKAAAKYPLTILTALQELTGITVEPVPRVSETIPGTPADIPTPTDGPAPADQKPKDAPTPSPDDAQKAASVEELERMLTGQAQLMHAVRFGVVGQWELLHPHACQEHLFSCPMTAAAEFDKLKIRPGAPGVYECWLNEFGQPIIGKPVPNLDTREMHSSDRRRSVHPAQLNGSES